MAEIAIPLWTTLDAYELVRDKIAEILAFELAGQAALGLPALRVPRVFTERSSPWGAAVADPPDPRPIVNVWFDTQSFDLSASNVGGRQLADGSFNVDVYAFAASVETVSGHMPADEGAARGAQEAMRLCRRILMSDHYAYLGLRGLVGRRWPQTLGFMQPEIETLPEQRVCAGRLVLGVKFNETGPVTSGPPLETIRLGVRRAESGELYFEAQYP